MGVLQLLSTKMTLHRPVRQHDAPALATELPLATPKIHPLPSYRPGDDASLWPRDLLVFLGASVLGFVASVFVLVMLFKDLSEEEQEQLVVPYTMDRAQQLGKLLTSLADKHFWRILLAHGFVYVYLQTFCVPGVLLANVFGGALFGMWLGFPLCVLYNTLGSVGMFLFSKYLGRRLVNRFFAGRLVEFRRLVNANRSHSTIYIICMRLFPFTPNWFINIASPQLHIPLWQFVLGCSVGLAPYNFLSCKAGLLLAHLKSHSDVIDTSSTIQLTCLGLVGLLIPIIHSRVRRRVPTLPASRIRAPKMQAGRPRASSCSL